MIERDRIEALTGLLADLDRDLARGDPSARRRRGAAVWVRLLVVLVAALALSNLYFVNDLTDEVRLVITRMQEMQELFTRVSGRMDEMSVEVASIEQNVLLMPVISDQMREMAGHVVAMEQAVSYMDQTTDSLDLAIESIDGNVREMSLRFRGLNMSVGAMGVDVDQMARPVP
jgi:methyl-accepting chemotaxis protein